MGEPAITARECRAMRLLDEDGWTPGELKMTFQLGTYHAVNYHLDGECIHGDL